ncbi:hypothetical protein ACQPZQ_32055 [Pseudonocardia sp. CA-142604]|uniref:hypothetical protein n=1 Tax=Pseudonocardia sp. CA-142604 TaxID=3240024 RepID=UPI003D8F1C22
MSFVEVDARAEKSFAVCGDNLNGHGGWSTWEAARAAILLKPPSFPDHERLDKEGRLLADR